MVNSEPDDFSTYVLPLWAVAYDADPDQVYYFNDPQRAFNSIIDTIRTYLGNSDAYEDECANFAVQLQKLWYQPSIPIRLSGQIILVYRFELDRHNPLHSVLAACYAKLDDPKLRDRIRSLFAKPLTPPLAPA